MPRLRGSSSHTVASNLKIKGLLFSALLLKSKV